MAAESGAGVLVFGAFLGKHHGCLTELAAASECKEGIEAGKEKKETKGTSDSPEDVHLVGDDAPCQEPEEADCAQVGDNEAQAAHFESSDHPPVA
ncbi:MAG: hypothetical protein ACSHYF_08950 [Verrucomicrobiaceae bacterium]